MFLNKPNPLWTSSYNPFETNKSGAVSKLLSGRYPTDWLCRKWTKTNPDGFCVLCPGLDLPGDVEHLLVRCQALEGKRDDIYNHWKSQTKDKAHLQSLLNTMLTKSPNDFIQFLLDPSVVPEVVNGCQNDLFTLDAVFHLNILLWHT